MALSSKQLLTLDWNRKELRLVLVRPRSDGVDLLKAACVPIPPGVQVEDPAAFGAFIKGALKDARIGVSRAVIAVPRDQVVLNTLNLPPTPPEEMPALVQFQVVKELPFAADQATLDFAVCGEFDPKLPSTVLVAAVRNEDLAYYTGVAQQAGLTLESVGLRPFANLVAVLGNNAELATKNTLVIEIGPQLTEIDILKKGVLAFSRSASVALSEFGTGAEGEYKDSRIAGPNVPNREPDEWSQGAVSALMVEIVRSFEAYRATDPTMGLDEIVVCGSSGLEAQLGEALAARFATHAELFTPDRALGLTAQRSRELRGFTTTIGLAMGHARRGLDNFDFRHPKKPVSKRQLRLKKIPVAAATAVLFIGSGVVFHLKFIAPRRAEVAALQKEVDEKKQEEEKILEFKSQLDALETWIDSEQYWPEVLLAVTESFPNQKEAYATRIDLETVPADRKAQREGRSLRRSVCRLKFRTVALGAVNIVAKRLEEAGFQNVLAQRETSSGGGDAYVKDTGVHFEIPGRSTFLALREAQSLRDEAPSEEAPRDEAPQNAPPSPSPDAESKADPSSGAAVDVGAPTDKTAAGEPPSAPAAVEKSADEADTVAKPAIKPTPKRNSTGNRRRPTGNRRAPTGKGAAGASAPTESAGAGGLPNGGRKEGGK